MGNDTFCNENSVAYNGAKMFSRESGASHGNFWST